MATFFWPPGKNDRTFLRKETLTDTRGHLVITAKFFWPISDRVNGGTTVIFNLMFLKKRTFHFLSAMAPKDGFRIGK